MDRKEKLDYCSKKINVLFNHGSYKEDDFLKETKISFAELIKIISENITEEEKERVQNSLIIFCLFEECDSCKKILKKFDDFRNNNMDCPSLVRGTIKQNAPKIIARTCSYPKELMLNYVYKKISSSNQEKNDLAKTTSSVINSDAFSKESALNYLYERIMRSITNSGVCYNSEESFLKFIPYLLPIVNYLSEDAFNDEILKESFLGLFENLTGLKV